MNRLELAIQKARRRSILNEAVHRGGIGVMAGLAAAIVLLAIDRLAPISVPAIVSIILPAIGAAAGAIHAALTHPDAFDVALRIDRSLHLKDRVATAHALLAKPANRSGTMPLHDEAFAQLVNRDAERLAGSLDIRTLAPLKISRTWGYAAGLAFALWAGHQFLPAIAWADPEAPSPTEPTAVAITEEEREEREQLRESIEETVEQLKRDLAEQRGEADDAELPIDPRIREQIEALERLAHQLSGDDGTVDVDQARDESAARLNEVAEQISREARRERESTERLVERFAGLDAPETPMTAREFQDALRRGDFGRAADLLEDRLGQKDEMSETERQELAEHLQRLHDQLDKQSRRDSHELTERLAQLEQVLRDHGIDEDLLRDLLEGEPLTQEEIERLLREQDVDPDLAERLARQLERLREERDLLEQTERDAEAVQDALREAAEELQREQEETPSLPDAPDELDETRDPDDQQPSDPAGLEQEEADERAERSEPREDTDRENGESPDAERTPTEGEAREPSEEREGAEEREAANDREAAREAPSDDPDAPQQETPDRPEREPDPDAPSDDPDADRPDQPDEPQPDSPQDEPAPGADQPATETGEEQPAVDPSSDPSGDAGDDPAQPEQDQAADPGADPDAPQQEMPMVGAEDETSQQPTAGEADDERDEGKSGAVDRPSPAERLRELQERRRRSQEQERISEEMIERAREMLDRMSPEERQDLLDEIQRQMQDAESPDSPPAAMPSAPDANGDVAGFDEQPTVEGDIPPEQRRDIDDIDLRPDDEDFDRVLAEWMSEEDVAPDREGVARRTPSQERVREVQRIAERAVEDAAVPGRYHRLIRRYFDRLGDRPENDGRE
jgi:hypothetical protein